MRYKKMNQCHGLSYDETLFLSYQKVPKIKIACSYEKKEIRGKSTHQKTLHQHNFKAIFVGSMN